jgi:hypothetical protein
MAATHTLAGRRANAAAPNLRAASILSVLALPLTALAAGAGLAVPGLYRDSPSLVPVLQGQDLVTLLALSVMGWGMLAAARGSARGVVVWAGVLGYLCYTYTGAALAYHFNVLTPVYIAVFGLAVFGLIALCAALDPAAIAARFDEGTPRRAVAGFLAFVVAGLGPAELAQLLPHLGADTLPAAMVQYGLTSFFVYALDLGLVVPLSALAAIWLLRGRPWGHLLAGLMLIKAAVMGLALLAMGWFAARAGLPGDGLTPLWAFIGLGGLAMSAWFLRHCR